jgi:micrococcal nuclease
MKKKNIKVIIGIVVIGIGLVTGYISKEEVLNELGFQDYILSSNKITTNTIENINSSELNKYKVISVTDGDTFKIDYNGQEKKVRLIGVDTPESVSPNKEKNNNYGKEASNYTKSRLEGKNILLEFDVQETDKYGRFLVYVYLEDGTMYNKELLEKGYAQVATYPPNVKYVEEFEEIQKKARENSIGFWSEKVFK